MAAATCSCPPIAAARRASATDSSFAVSAFSQYFTRDKDPTEAAMASGDVSSRSTSKRSHSSSRSMSADESTLRVDLQEERPFALVLLERASSKNGPSRGSMSAKRRSAPASQSSVAVLESTRAIAVASGVVPLASQTSSDARASTRIAALAGQKSTAMCRAVSPSALATSRLAPSSRSIEIRLCRPSITAAWRAVPSSSCSSMSMRRSCRISERTQSSLLPSRTQRSSRSSGVSSPSASSDEALLDREELLDREDRVLVPRSSSPNRIVTRHGGASEQSRHTRVSSTSLSACKFPSYVRTAAGER
eukprot:2807858-Prymnesium_polylepis.1